jgi:hypothetical protein
MYLTRAGANINEQEGKYTRDPSGNIIGIHVVFVVSVPEHLAQVVFGTNIIILLYA